MIPGDETEIIADETRRPLGNPTITNRDAVKWKAVKAIAEYYDCDTDTFVAFGDNINDLEMIQKCGTGIAVKNAISQVQSVAKYICETNDNDGAARWIAQHLLCHNG
jgi:hydroxymethylpyrimidine pyrophosphatase-like HAD family hydrolase